MTEATTERELTDGELKICCATFYQSDLVRMLLGDVLHPGGLGLTRQMGEALELKSEAHAAEQGVEQLTAFQLGDAEGLPFDDGAFDVVVSECSFCTFSDKVTAAAQMACVLRCACGDGSPGRLGLTDMTVNGELPDELQTLLAWVACVAGAGPSGAYVATLERAGFDDFRVSDQRDSLLDMVNGVRHKLLGVELLQKLDKLDLIGLDLSEGKRQARLAAELIEGGTVGYALITARKT